MYIILCLFLGNSIFYCQQNLSVIKLNDIYFGSDFGGKEKRLKHTDDGTAKFQIHSKIETDIVITILIPNYFINANGLEKIPISFSDENAGWSTVDNISSRITFDPRQPLILSIKENQLIYVWIGGILHPSQSQRSGKYTGNITLTVQTLPRN